MIFPSCVLTNSSPSLALVAEDSTNFNIVQRENIMPLSLMGRLSSSVYPSNKWPTARLLAPETER